MIWALESCGLAWHVVKSRRNGSRRSSPPDGRRPLPTPTAAVGLANVRSRPRHPYDPLLGARVCHLAAMILWKLSERLGLREALTRLYRVRISGAGNVPAGACILVANHESVIDPWFLSLATRRHVRFMAKAELWRYPPVRWAMEAYGTFPVERGSGDTGAMTRAGELLAEGAVLGMFPRGTSKPAGNRTWHRGAARLALAHRATPARAAPEHKTTPAPPSGRGAHRRADRCRATPANDRHGARADRARRVSRGGTCVGLRRGARHVRPGGCPSWAAAIVRDRRATRHGKASDRPVFRCARPTAARGIDSPRPDR